jgi:hypothetical protein
VPVIAALTLTTAATAAEFWCSNTTQIQIAQKQDEFSLANASEGKNARRGRHKIERFDVLQAYSGQPVLVGSTWLTACLTDPSHLDTRAAFAGLIGVNPESSAAMARSTGLVDRGIRLTRDMKMCLIENAPAVGYTSIPFSADGGVKPCF